MSQSVDLTSGIRAGFLLLWVLTAPWGTVTAAADRFMEPGPLEMSDEEKAIVADPTTGIEHGVILKVEIRRKEDEPLTQQYGLHLRAKILSSEARDLGNVEIRFDTRRWKLKEWWGRVIRPDGEVTELAREDLQEHTLSRTRGREIVIRKGALPGLEPGAVIDYGFTVQRDNARFVSPWWSVGLQWPWPILELHYLWTPYEYLANGFVTTRARDLDVKVVRDFKHVRVTGRNLPPVKKEPYMPPVDSVRGAAWFFYFNKDEKYKDFWSEKSVRIDKRAASFLEDVRRPESLLERMGLPAGGTLEEKLKAAYDWIVENIEIDEARFEEGLSSLRADWTPKKMKDAGEIVAGSAGAGVHRILLMMAAARLLGAEAHIVLAADRTDHYWNKAVWTMSQLDEAAVAVRAPGEPVESSRLLAPHYGLPYGVVPYWVSASPAMVATSAGAVEWTPPMSPAEENVSRSSVEISFEMEGEPATVSWGREGSGQHGVELEFALRESEEGGEREKRLQAMCTGGAAMELETARSADAEDAAIGPRLECEGSLPEIVAEPGLDVMEVPLAGPWFETIPEFTRRKRTHQMVFDYPCTDHTVMEVKNPDGYVASVAPKPVVIDNPFGSYSLKVEVSETGYRVERVFRFPHLVLPADRLSGIRYFLAKVKKADRAVLRFEAEGES